MKQKIDIFAFSVGKLEELNSYIVGFYDDPDRVNEGYEIQMSLEEDDQDIELGIDTYCMVDNFGRTVYGGIASCIIDMNVLSIVLERSTVSVFEKDSLEFKLHIQDKDIEKVLTGLKKIFSVCKRPPEINF